MNFVGGLRDGGLLAYEAFVLDVEVCLESAGVPPLYGLDLLDRDNGLFDSRDGVIYCLPVDFKAANIAWPPGTRRLQCVKGAGGNWLLEVIHWSKVDPAELRRVRAIRNNCRSQ